jgi:hypothetical protein
MAKILPPTFFLVAKNSQLSSKIVQNKLMRVGMVVEYWIVRNANTAIMSQEFAQET